MGPALSDIGGKVPMISFHNCWDEFGCSFIEKLQGVSFYFKIELQMFLRLSKLRIIRVTNDYCL